MHSFSTLSVLVVMCIQLIVEALISCMCHLVNFADDTELAGKISNDNDALCHVQIKNLMNWCDKNYFYLKVSKTEEMCIDFRKNQTCSKPVYIKEAVERVET